jgi:glycolate oxidase iron-sulfur subunit
MEALTPRVRRHEGLPELISAVGPRRAVVGLLTGCVQSVFFSHVNAATARLLAADGCDVVIPISQGCCGALSIHSGREQEAIAFAKGTIDQFERAGVDFVAVNAAGCGSAMKDYAELLRDDDEYAPRARELAAKVRDVSELLMEIGPVAPRHPLDLSIAYHDACHHLNAQGIRMQPRRLLAQIADLDVREIANPEICCGSAGVYNLLNPGPAQALGDRKAEEVAATDAPVLVTANPGCMMQIAAAARRGGVRLRVAHLVEVLDASVRGLDPGDVGFRE